MKMLVTTTSDPSLEIINNEIIMSQDVSIDVYRSRESRMPFVTIIKDRIKTVNSLPIGHRIMYYSGSLNFPTLLEDGLLRLIKGDKYDEFMELVTKARANQFIK